MHCLSSKNYVAIAAVAAGAHKCWPFCHYIVAVAAAASTDEMAQMARDAAAAVDDDAGYGGLTVVVARADAKRGCDRTRGCAVDDETDGRTEMRRRRMWMVAVAHMDVVATMVVEEDENEDEDEDEKDEEEVRAWLG